MSSTPTRSRCDLHGPSETAFVCQHIARGLFHRERVGFYWTDEDPDDPNPDALCEACEERRIKAGGAWGRIGGKTSPGQNPLRRLRSGSEDFPHGRRSMVLTSASIRAINSHRAYAIDQGQDLPVRVSVTGHQPLAGFSAPREIPRYPFATAREARRGEYRGCIRQRGRHRGGDAARA